MPRNRKYYPHNATLLVTTRTETGIPLPPNDVVNLLLKEIIAQARSLYNVHVRHHTFMGNHFHLMLVVDNPEHVGPFIGYIKAESAHAINHLLGKK